MFILELSVKKETNFSTTKLGWLLICISWQVYFIGSSHVICPREPSTLHNMNFHNSYHVCPSLPAALAGMAMEIWVIRSQLRTLYSLTSTLHRGRRVLCCWLHVEGKERLSLQVGWMFVGWSLVRDKHCGWAAMEPPPAPWSPKASRAGKHGQPAQCLLSFQTRPRVKWGHDRSVKGKGFLLWDSISEVVTWQIWVGCWFSEDCQKATEWVAV